MVFGVVLAAGFDVFFEEAVFFFFVLFLAVLFLAGAFLAVVLGAVVLEPCACAANGTVDAPTNASRANAEINAFILDTPEVLFEVRAGGENRTCPDRSTERNTFR
ncbi:MAG TPA: hypothetical protein VHX19_14420 [Stellaceae bacterium]|jgi:hypothetical protein|nr:hypothetical protein [Stellaceae bacterium]